MSVVRYARPDFDERRYRIRLLSWMNGIKALATAEMAP
jgi:hypothetical protein